MNQQRRDELMRQGREYAARLISTGVLVLDAAGEWGCRGDLPPAPEEAALPAAEYEVWLTGHRDELQRRRELHGAVTAPFPRSAPLTDDEAEALERYEHALDCDLPDHSRCDVGD